MDILPVVVTVLVTAAFTGIAMYAAMRQRRDDQRIGGIRLNHDRQEAHEHRKETQAIAAAIHLLIELLPSGQEPITGSGDLKAGDAQVAGTGQVITPEPAKIEFKVPSPTVHSETVSIGENIVVVLKREDEHDRALAAAEWLYGADAVPTNVVDAIKTAAPDNPFLEVLAALGDAFAEMEDAALEAIAEDAAVQAMIDERRGK